MTLSTGLAAAAAALLVSTGCSLLCSTSGLAQDCDADGDCEPGYTCNAKNKCEKSVVLADSGPSGCAFLTQDTDCPAGACINGFCADQLIPWSDGSQQTLDTSCFASYPPAPTSADGGFALFGCIVELPGDTVSGEPSVSVNLNAGLALVGAGASCSSGYNYLFPNSDAGVPIGQLFELDTFTDAGPTMPIRTYPVYVSQAQTANPQIQRNAFTISPTRAASLLSEMGVTIAPDAGFLGGGTLILGVVNDCAATFSGNQLSGVQVVVQKLNQPVSYLNANGDVVPGRTATDPSGMFASYVPADASSLISISYFEQEAAGDGGELGFGPESSVIALDIKGPGVIWVTTSAECGVVRICVQCLYRRRCSMLRSSPARSADRWLPTPSQERSFPMALRRGN